MVCSFGRRDREGERGFREEVFCFQVKGADFVVSDSDAADYGFGAQVADFEQVLERGLVVGVAEGVVVGGGGVPSLGERGGGFCTFFFSLAF